MYLDSYTQFIPVFTDDFRYLFKYLFKYLNKQTKLVHAAKWIVLPTPGQKQNVKES